MNEKRSFKCPHPRSNRPVASWTYWRRKPPQLMPATCSINSWLFDWRNIDEVAICSCELSTSYDVHVNCSRHQCPVRKKSSLLTLSKPFIIRKIWIESPLIRLHYLHIARWQLYSVCQWRWRAVVAVCGQAEQFNDAIQVVRNWLPEAEAELKLHSIPDDEESIMQAIDNHEVRHICALCTPCFRKKHPLILLAIYKLRNSCLILIIFDTKISDIIWHRTT